MSTISNSIQAFDPHAPIVPKTVAQKRLLEAAEALESVFSSYLLKGMGEGLPGTPKSTGGEIFGGMFQEALSNQIAHSQSLGVSKTIYHHTIALVEKQEGPDGLKPLPRKAP